MSLQSTTWVVKITYVHPTTGVVTVGYIVLPNAVDLHDDWALAVGFYQ